MMKSIGNIRFTKSANGELLVDGTEELRVRRGAPGSLSQRKTDRYGKSLDTELRRAHSPYGERFTIDGLEVLVEKASKRRIRRVRILSPTEPNSMPQKSASNIKETNADDSSA